MTDKHELTAIEKFIDKISSTTLGSLIKSVEQSQLLFGYNGLSERLETVKRDYGLMRDFMFTGGNDRDRDFIYNHLKQRLYRVLADARIIFLIKYNRTMTAAKNNSLDASTMILELRDRLEEFEGDLAMAALEVDAQSKAREVYTRLHDFRQKYFNTLLVSSQISETQELALADVILAPTVSHIDRVLIVSALMLAIQMQYDDRKFSALLQALRRSQDEQLRAHLLVALMLSLRDERLNIYPDTDSLLLETLSTPQMKQQLMELQIQMDITNRVDEYGRHVQEHIMPDLVKHSEEAMHDDGPLNNSSLGDILDASASESSIEKLEQKISEMENLKQQGIDIYYQGFSRMKRESFLYTLVNGFYPVTADHPQLSNISEGLLRSRMFDAMVRSSALCDSDVYSIMLGMQSVWKMMPEKMRNLVETQEFVMPDESAVHTPAYFRRMYLQNLIRFYRIYTSKTDLMTPFDDKTRQRYKPQYRWLFLANRLFADSGLFVDELVDLTRYFFKKKQDVVCNRLMDLLDFHELTHQQELLLDIIEAIIAYRRADFLTCSDIMADVLDQTPDNQLCMEYFVDASIQLKEYSAAADYAQQLAMLHPENIKHQLNHFAILLATDAKDEASELLFRLYFDYPDNPEVVRQVAMLYLRTKRADQALELLQKDEQHADQLILVLCLIVKRRLTDAVAVLQRYYDDTVASFHIFDASMLLSELSEHLDLITPYGLTLTDLEMVVDCCKIGKG